MKRDCINRNTSYTDHPVNCGTICSAFIVKEKFGKYSHMGALSVY